jgi:bifunctional DNA-binding transcriptional regulator/antitoxin component of YhaV-PrlF toxin-antitoxin module
MEVAITKMSSKGQVVIPQAMRNDIKQGDKLFLVKDKNSIVMRKMGEKDKQLQEDLEFARRTEEAYKRHECGDFIAKNWDDFIEDLKRC